MKITLDHIIDASRRMNEYLDLHGIQEGHPWTTVQDDRARAAMMEFIGLAPDTAEALWEVCRVSTATPAEAVNMWSGVQFALYAVAIAGEEEIGRPAPGLPRRLEDELDELGGGE